MGELRVGTFVQHPNNPAWGVGRVLCVSDRHVLVAFRDRQAQDRFTRLDRASCALEVTRDPEDAVLAGFQVEADGQCKPLLPTKNSKKPPLPLVAELSVERAYQLFLTTYKEGFGGERFIRAERSWKLEKHLEWLEHFSGTGLRDGAEADPVGTARRVMRVVQTTVVPLIHPRGEIPVFSHALEAPEPTRRYLEALAGFIETLAPSAEVFDRLVAALTSLPSNRKGGRLASWSILTVVPFLAKPTHHMFLKPVPTKAFARRIGFDLLYSPSLKWDTYERLLQMSAELLEHLRPVGAVDFIDVQSFMWTVVKGMG